MSLIRGDAIAIPLRDDSVDLVVTSPPYFALRSYTDGGEHYDGQIGSEPTPQAFLEALWAVTAECRRVLKPSGSMWVNLGDKYSGNATGGPLTPSGSTLHNPNKDVATNRARTPYLDTFRPKTLLGLPWRYAIGCVDNLDLILRAEVIWSKPNGLPESVTDRVRRSHEQWFHFTKEPRYFAAVDEVREPSAPPTSTALRYRAVGGTSGLKANGDRGDAGKGNFVPSPLGKLPGSVWEGLDCTPWERMMLSGPPAFCPRCGRDLAAGSGPPTRIRVDTAAPSDPTETSSTSTDSPTNCSSGPSPKGSPSTTSAAIADAATPNTSRPSREARTSSAAGSPSKLTASTGTASTTHTQTSDPTAASVGSAASVHVSASASCVCEGLGSPSGPSSIWTVPSEPLRVPDWLGVDHFAAFPQELPRRIILGWSPSGICVECGQGRRPVVERHSVRSLTDTRRGRGDYANGRSRNDGDYSLSGQEAAALKAEHPDRITGYACDCPTPTAPTRPAVVLDPFGGTGTTAMVARALGRYPVHIDLSADYLKLARWRIYESGHASKTAERTNRERQGVLL